MINYNRLGYEIKRDLANFSEKISNGLKRPQSKFLLQMIYGILAGNKLHLSEIARSLNENITLKKTIDRLSRNLSAFKEKVFSAAEKGVISATHENLQCLKSLSAHFSKNCVSTFDRGFDANDYYRYFLKNDEKFVIRSKKNRNVIYNGKRKILWMLQVITKEIIGWILKINMAKK